MPIVRVEWYKGRSEDQKAAVAKAITEAMQTHANVKPDGLFIVFEDVELSNWASGGVLASRKQASPPGR